MTLGITLMLTGCLKKPCQDLVTEPYSTFTEVEWRLVETNDPAQAGTLSNFTFTTITFELSFEGEIKPYINNRELDENVTPFAYQVFPDQDALQITSLNVRNGQQETLTYFYDLGRDFTLTNAQTGNFYRYVEFDGFVEPDNDCTF